VRLDRGAYPRLLRDSERGGTVGPQRCPLVPRFKSQGGGYPATMLYGGFREAELSRNDAYAVALPM
jgi:hypothetical protein